MLADDHMRNTREAAIVSSGVMPVDRKQPEGRARGS
jgi:hypothetical protein